ncbi:MAG: hypothetical protein KGV51_00960 [Moraxellaceae bacterium]|nr:hypothetical protein [Moraxellaceae bacterium]
MKTITLEFQEDINQEQFSMVTKLLEAVNIKVKAPQKIENPFNYDLERMKDRVENQEFVACPDNVQSAEDFRAWLTEVAV